MFLCFFLMIRRPPRSTLFPTRRSSDLLGLSPLPCIYASIGSCPEPIEARSEEHTSELQSPDHLVCRLLLQKTIIIFNKFSFRISEVPLTISHKRLSLNRSVNGYSSMYP